MVILIMNHDSKIEKNAEIIRKRFDSFADELLKYGLNNMSPTNAIGIKSDSVDKLIRPMLKPFVRLSGDFKRARKEIARQTDVVIEFSKNAKSSNTPFNSLPTYDDCYDKFLENDTLYRILETKDEKIEKDFLSIKKEHFDTLIEGMTLILDGEGETYYELVKSVCKERKEAERLLNGQFQFLDKYRKFNPYYRLPAKKEVLRLLKLGEEEAKRILKEEIDETYA